MFWEENQINYENISLKHHFGQLFRSNRQGKKKNDFKILYFLVRANQRNIVRSWNDGCSWSCIFQVRILWWILWTKLWLLHLSNFFTQKKAILTGRIFSSLAISKFLGKNREPFARVLAWNLCPWKQKTNSTDCAVFLQAILLLSANTFTLARWLPIQEITSGTGWIRENVSLTLWSGPKTSRQMREKSFV